MVELRKANVLDYARFVLSALILLFSGVVTSYAIIERKTGFWPIVPGWAALILFVIDLFLLGIVEGLQIALVELKRQHPESYKQSHPGAFCLGQTAAQGDNVERFLMGRQVFVVFLVFFAAKLTTINLEEGEAFLIPAPFWFRSVFLETGILACIVVVIIAQLMPQIVAAKYPVHFLQIFIMRPAYYTCVFVEMTGLTHICWLLSAALGYVMGMRDDDLYEKGQEEPKSASKAIKDMHASLQTVMTDVDLSDEHTNMDKIPPSDILEKSVTPMGQNQYSRFSTLVEHISKQLDPNVLLVVRHYLDNHPEQFRQFPSVIGNRMYPSPQAIAEELKRDGLTVPTFLTDISDPDHVPPHIIACELIAQNRALVQKLAAVQPSEQHQHNTRL